MTKKAIGLAEFNELMENHKVDLLHRDGVYVGKRKTGNRTTVLFQLYGFYVEVFYKQYRKQIDKLVTTDNPSVLHHYIDQVKIKGLDQKPENPNED
jgi:hypothetical protein